MTFKICADCGESKPFAEYYKYKSSSDGYDRLCKICKKREFDRYHASKQKDIVSLADAKRVFESLFLDTDFELTKLAWNHRYSYAISFGNEWLPVTIKTANYESRYAYLTLPEKGVVVCWKSPSEIAYYFPCQWDKSIDRTVWSKLSVLARNVTKADRLLKSIYKNVNKDEIDMYPLNLISSWLTIEKDKHDTMRPESEFNKFMLDQFDEKLHKCPEGCLSDLYYGNGDLVLPLQLKSSNHIPKCGDFNIKCGGNYGKMIVLLRHLTAEKGTFVIPGNILPKTVICGKWNGKYQKYLVSDDDLVDFIDKLYHAIKLRQNTCQWPGGDTIKISALNLWENNTAMIPVQKLHKQEREYFVHRTVNFPKLIYTLPKKDGSCIDVIINNVNIQDKVATLSPNNSYHLRLNKSNGRKKKQPYKHGDFDALWIYLPDKKTFYLIPSDILLSHDYFQTDNCVGKQTLCWVPANTDKKSNNYWIKNYRYRYQQKGIEEKIIDILEKIKKN